MKKKNMGKKGNSSAKRIPFPVGFTALILLFLIFVFVAVCIGSAHLSIRDALHLILSKLPGIGQFVQTQGINEVYEQILFQVRLPRVLLAGLVGMGLSVTGTALGATLAMLFGAGTWVGGISLTGLFAFAGGLSTVFVVYRIACVGGGVQTVHLLLMGTAVSSFLSAVISFLMTRNKDGLEKIYMWTLGSFGLANWEKVCFLGIFLLLCSAVLFAVAGELNLLLTGEDTAATLGVSINNTRIVGLFAGTFLVAACVSVSGVIGFVGLIVPHCMRLIFGPDHRVLFWCAALCGASFMIFCDMLARTVTAPTEIPVGVVTALCGAPYFIFLLGKNKRGQIK